MEVRKIGRFIRVDIRDDENAKSVIEEIKRYVNGWVEVSEDCDSVIYSVNGRETEYKAEAILTELGLDEDSIINPIYNYELKPQKWGITCSRKENDTSIDASMTDRTRWSNKSPYQLVEILYNQPYITDVHQPIPTNLKVALEVVANAIIAARNK